MPKDSLGSEIPKLLKLYGVDVVFGVPGVHNQELYRALEESGIVHVLARHEQGAGFMADGYARATGKVGVAFVISGPGLCNIMTPMGQAYSDSVPMLVISSCLDDSSLEGQLHHMLDQEGAAASVCEWSATAIDYKSALNLIGKAFKEFSSRRGRPKHIQIPINSLKSSIGARRPFDHSTDDMPERKKELRQAAALIRNSKTPLFVLGGGAVKVNFEKFLKITNAAVFTTFAGKGIVKPSYPFLMGPNLHRRGSDGIINKADLLVVIGSELGEADLWRKNIGHRCQMIRVDIDSDIFKRNKLGSLNILMKAQEFVSWMEKLLESTKSEAGWLKHEITAAKRKCFTEACCDYPGILPVIDCLKKVMPRNAMVFSDMTQMAYLSQEIWDMQISGHWHHPTGFGALGYAIPAAIGGAIARPGLTTVAITGDYGFQYTMSEISVAAELKLSLPILLWNNCGLKAIEDSMISAQIKPSAIRASSPNFCLLAKAFGITPMKPESIPDLSEMFEIAISTKMPNLIIIDHLITG